MSTSTKSFKSVRSELGGTLGGTIKSSDGAAEPAVVLAKDYAIFRGRQASDVPEVTKLVLIVNETDMSRRFLAAKPDFQGIESVQTCVKQRLKPNKDAPIVVNFYAPIDKDDPGAPIVFDYKSLGDDE